MQPDRDYPTRDTKIMYKEMVRRNQEQEKKIKHLAHKRRIRCRNEESIRRMWDSLSDAEKSARVMKLTQVCTELIERHPDYKKFKSCKVYWPIRDEETGQEMARIHWNGRRANLTTGWNLVDKEFPACDVPIVVKRVSDKLRNFTTDDDV